MISLLAAGLIRLRKSRIFWTEMLFLIVEMIIVMSENIFYAERIVSLDGFWLYSMKNLGVYIAVFADLFLGTEYRDNAIRNKFMGGHSKAKIYLSYLISCYAAGLLFFMNYLLAASVLGLLFRAAPLKMTPIRLLTLLLPAIMVTGAFSSVFTLAAMLASGKFILALPSYMFMVMLNLMTESKDFLPFTQSLQLAAGEVVHPLRLSLYSAILLSGATLTGIWLFRRKDIA